MNRKITSTYYKWSGECGKLLNIFWKGAKNRFPIFLVNLFAASAVYSLLMVNQLVNQLDGLWHGSVSYAYMHELQIGRWFWLYLDRARMYLSPDPVTSVISLTLFIASILLILDLLEVTFRPVRYAVSLLFTINVSVLVSLSYRYMSPTFALACFLSVFAAYMIIRCRKLPLMLLSASVSLALMMGLYQADLGCTCLVLLLYLSLRLLRNDASLKELGIFLIKAFIAMAVGAALYYLLLYLNLRYYDTELSSYGGASEYGIAETLLNLPEGWKKALSSFQEYFKNSYIRSSMLPGKAYIVFFIVTAVHLIYGGIMLFKKSRLKALLFLITLLLIPAACNAVMFIAFDTFLSVQMTVPMSLCFPMLIGLCSNIPVPRNPAGGAGRVIFAGMICLLLYGNYLMVQYDQQAMYMGMKSMKELAAEIRTELQALDLYRPYYQYCFVGTPADNPLFVKNLVYEKANSYATIGTWDADDTRFVIQSWQGLWTHEMGVNLRVADDEKLVEALEDENVRNMPVFPERGSCAMINDVVVVKVSDISQM